MATTAAVESYDAVIMKAISVLNQNHARITNSMVKNGSPEDEVANRFAQNTIDGIETHRKALCVFIGHDVALAPGALQKLLEPFGLSRHIKDQNSIQPSEQTPGSKSDTGQVQATPGPSEVATQLEERQAHVEADTEMADVAPGADEGDARLEERPAASETDAEQAHAASVEDNHDPKQAISSAGENLDMNLPVRNLGPIVHRQRVGDIVDVGEEAEEARTASNNGDGNEQLGASVKDNHDTEQISTSPDGKLKKTVPVSDSRPIANSPGSASGAREESNDWSTARRSRGMKHQGTTFHDYGGVQGLVASPTIIKLKDGTFIELRCHVCNGNSSWVHGTYNKGVRGFQSHLRQVHGETTKVEAVLQRCKHREVSAQEAERIMNGEQHIPMVPCLQKINVGRNVEYIGNLAADQGKRKSGGGRVQTPAAANATDRVSLLTVERAPSSSQGRGTKRARTDEDDATQVTADNATQPKKRTRTNNHNASSATTNTADLPKKRVRDITLPSIKNCAVIVRTTIEKGSDRCVELRCGVCGGNGSFGSGRLLDGVKGFKMHFKQIHKETLRTADILRRCSHRDVPSSEVQAIEAGTARIGFIRAEGSPNVRPKASYQHFDDAARAVTSTTQPGTSQAE